MDFKLTEDQVIIKEAASAFAAKELAPIISDLDKAGKFSREIYNKMGDVNLTGVLIPPPFGGVGLGATEFALAVEEIAKVSASMAVSLVTSTHVGFLILAFGSDEQRLKYLPALAKGEKMGAFAFTEPSGGTNWPMSNQTTAVLKGDKYIVNGSKCFISNASEADIYIVLARTNPQKGPMGFSTIIIEKDSPGFTFGRLEDKFGLRGYPIGELFFDDCSVPKENLLGGEDQGLMLFQAGAAVQCVGVAATNIGLSQAALNSSIKYSKEKMCVPPATLSSLETVQASVAEMMSEVEATRLLNYKSTTLTQGPNPEPILSALYSSRIALKVTGKAVSLHGGFGCTNECEAGRYFRDAKTLSLQMTYDHIISEVGKLILDPPEVSA